jgi:hypothetical protein
MGTAGRLDMKHVFLAVQYNILYTIEKLNWSEHINGVVAKARKNLEFVIRSLKGSSMEAKEEGVRAGY